MNKRHSTQTIAPTEHLHPDIEPNVAAVFSYLIPIIGGFLFSSVLKENKLVQFHSKQAIAFWTSAGLISFLIDNVKIKVIQSVIGGMLPSVVFGFLFYLVYKAYMEEEYEIPYLGKMVKKNLNSHKK